MSRPGRPAPTNRRLIAWLSGGLAGMLAFAATAGFLWLRPSPSVVGSTPEAPAQQQTQATVAPVGPNSPPPEVVVSVRAGIDVLHVRTARYEAAIDREDGCLCSLRVGGVEFLKNGAALAGGKTFARGGYFYYDKDGHQGLVKMPSIKQPAANVIVATGDKFSVRYEFGPESLSILAQNATDDTVPYYLIFDSATVQEVVNDKGERLSVPAAKLPAEPLDLKWKTTSWTAGRARLRVVDLTDRAATRIWGPFSEFASQVWESDATTYNRCHIVLEPSLGPELETPEPPPGGLLITREASVRRIQSELYEAVVGEDGCLSSLRVDGVEMLRANVDVSRGVYFLQNTTLRLPDVRQPSANCLTAAGDKASIRYDFSPDRMSWAVENKTDQPMSFFMVFDASISAVRNDKDQWVKTPTVQDGGTPDRAWAKTTWFAGRARLKAIGGSRVWGPWAGKYQVWEASLAPREKRLITVEMGLASPAEAALAARTSGAALAPAAELVLSAPLDYQVFQRRTKLQGAVTVRGRIRPAYDRLEVRLSGKSLQGPLSAGWQEVPLKKKTRGFEAVVGALAGGWYKVEVRAVKDGKVVAESAVDHVGVGEVFIASGQSNSTNCGQHRTRQISGMVSAFSGHAWQIADDPLPGVHDNSTGGSCWPAFGDAMFARYQTPIGVVSIGHSGTSVNQWTPGGELFRWTTGRLSPFGREGFRAVLWHQGESDVGMSAEEYARKMTALIRESRRAVGWDVPWFVAQVSYLNPGQPSFPGPRGGQKALWDAGVALEGPDTDTLTGEHRDEGGKGIHFSPKGLHAHGKMWADRVAVYLDQQLAR